MENPKPYATIITTIALALFALFWTTIDAQLKVLDSRLRCVEREIATISASLGIRADDPDAAPAAQSRASAGLPLSEGK